MTGSKNQIFFFLRFPNAYVSKNVEKKKLYEAGID